MYSETRPWGAFYILDEAPGFKVKRIVVKAAAGSPCKAINTARNTGRL